MATDGANQPSVSVEAVMLQKFAEGDENALDELVKVYQEPAFWVSRHVVHDDEMAKDLVQDAFIKVLRKPELYDPSRPFKAWFLQVVRNLSIDYLRKKRPNTVQVIAESAEVDGEQSSVEPVARKELRHKIEIVLESVPEKYRELIILRDVEGLGPDEIAQMTGVEYGTTRWRIHNARKLFRKAWLERYGEDIT
jgi:RNA polymerase sigma-70 factor (ECF subfamily)